MENGPAGVAYDPDNHEMYVANSKSNTVSVINSSNSVVTTINVGNGPAGVAYDPDNHEMYVTNELSNTVSVIDTLSPFANAGSNQHTQPHQTVHLNGSASFDSNGLTPLTYNWSQTSGPIVSLSNPNSVAPSFVAPNVSEDTALTFQFIVTNSNDIPSIPSSVAIEVIVLSSTHPSPQQNNGSITNSNNNSFINDRFSHHNTTITNSSVNSFNNNGHNKHLNYQSQNSYNLQSPMCLTVFGSCDTISGKQSQNMYYVPDG
ncbi:MAG TPA: hypothetical protein VIY08_09845 [Candidatus Nitrosocosmicus sp.]